MAKCGIGLDIGTSAVKIVEVEGGPRSIKINRFGIIPLPVGSLSGGVVTNIDEVSRAIVGLFQSSKITRKQVLVAIAGQAVIVRNIKMPSISKDELKDAVRWEAEKYIPFPVDEVTMDYQVIKQAQEQNELEIMLVCAHNDIIKSHLGTLKDANIQPLAIDIQPFALMRSVGLENSVNNSSIALLDIGAGTTDLTIVKSGIPRFTRIIPLAGLRLTENLAKSLGVSFAEAEQMKITYSDALFDPTQYPRESSENKVNFSISESLRELVLELRRSFDYYQLQQRNEEISQLIIAGGGGKMKNLISFLNKELGIPVVAAQAANEFSSSNKNVQAQLNEQLPMLMVAYGLALREVIPDAN